MFIKAGVAIINIKTITHLRIAPDQAVYVYFIGGDHLFITAHDAKPLLARMELVLQVAAQEDAQIEEELYGSPAA